MADAATGTVGNRPAAGRIVIDDVLGQKAYEIIKSDNVIVGTN